MKKSVIIIILLVLTLIIPHTLEVRGYSNIYQKTYYNNNMPYIVVSIPSLAMIVKHITGNASIIDTILPEGVDPHSYSLTVEDVEKINKADLLILADVEHLTLEAQILEISENKIFLDFKNYTAYGAYMIDIPGFKHNFHGYWIYPDNALAIAEAIHDTLSSMFPQLKEHYDENLNVFKEKISELKMEFRAVSEKYGLNNTGVAIAVPGVAYIAKMFGFEIKALFIKGPGRFINATEIAKIENDIRSGKIKYIVCESILKDAKAGELSEQIAEDTGIQVIYVSIFSLRILKDYFSLMTYNIAAVESVVSHQEGGKDQQLQLFSMYIVVGILAIISFIEGFIIFRMRKSIEE